jgi:ADP-heptose:LPS heptosyltransferase
VLRSLERHFKRGLAAALGFLIGSRPLHEPLPESFDNILVVRQHNQLGDMLCAVPLLRGLRHRFPSAHIAILASPVNVEVMEGLCYLDEVLCFDKSEFTRHGIRGFLRLFGYLRGLRRKAFDLVIVPSTVSTSFTSDFLAYVTGARYRIGIGSLDGVENRSAFFFNIPIHTHWRATPHRHQTLRNLDCAVSLGLPLDDLSHELTLKGTEVIEAKLWFEEKKAGSSCAIALHPGAGKPPNRWPAENFAAVAMALAREFSASIYVTSGPMDKEVVDSLLKALKNPVELIENQAIRRVASYLGQMDLVISNDTGIMHVAAAVGTPVLSLFGPTDPEQWAPIGGGNRYIAGSDGGIETIAVDQVLQNAREMLNEGPRSRNEGRGKPA